MSNISVKVVNFMFLNIKMSYAKLICLDKAHFSKIGWCYQFLGFHSPSTNTNFILFSWVEPSP